MKYTNPAAILNPNAPATAPGSLLSPGGDDFLSRINSTISNFKELLKLAQEVRGFAGGELLNNTDEKPSGAQPVAQGGGLAQVVGLAIQSGYGDTPIGELLDHARPFTLRQIIEVVNRARPE